MKTDVMNSANISVSYSLGRLNFLFKASNKGWIGGKFRPDGFEGNAFAKVNIVGFVDLAHAALTEDADDAKAASDESGWWKA